MIRIENLTKSFGLKKVVDDLSFSVERGEVLGFLGPYTVARIAESWLSKDKEDDE